MKEEKDSFVKVGKKNCMYFITESVESLTEISGKKKGHISDKRLKRYRIWGKGGWSWR